MALVSTFLILTIIVFVSSNRKLSSGLPLDRAHLILLRLLGTILLVLVKGTLLILLEIMLSPLLCFSASESYPGCKTSVMSNWYASVVGIVLSLSLILATSMSATFSTRDCFIKINYLSSATPSCELLDQLVKIAALCCAMFASNMGKPVAAGVNSLYLDPPALLYPQKCLVQFKLELPQLHIRVSQYEMDRFCPHTDHHLPIH